MTMLSSTSGDAAVSEFAFVVPLEKFVFRTNGAWNVAEPVGQLGIENHLLELGWDAETVEAALDAKAYLRVYGHDLAPGKPSVFVQDGRMYLNSWAAPTLKPKPGPYPRITKTLEWLTQGDAEGIRWLKGWMAAKVQNPNLVPKVAVVLATQPGGGKGTLAYCMRSMLGFSNTEIIKRENIAQRFNARWIDKLFVLADEILSADNLKDITAQLKVLIDSNELEFEGKYKNSRTVQNRLAWMFASNDTVAPVIVERGDRRYSVFVNHEALPSDYVSMLNSCFEADRTTPTPGFLDEIAGLYHELLHTSLDWAFISRPYVNEARKELIEASLTSYEMFFRLVDEGGIDELIEHVVTYRDYSLSKTRDSWDRGEEGVSTQIIYRCYVEYCQRIGAHALKLNRFGSALQNNRPQWSRVRHRTPDGKQVYCYKVPRTARLDAR